MEKKWWRHGWQRRGWQCGAKRKSLRMQERRTTRAFLTVFPLPLSASGTTNAESVHGSASPAFCTRGKRKKGLTTWQTCIIYDGGRYRHRKRWRGFCLAWFVNLHGGIVVFRKYPCCPPSCGVFVCLHVAYKFPQMVRMRRFLQWWGKRREARKIWTFNVFYSILVQRFFQYAIL